MEKRQRNAAFFVYTGRATFDSFPNMTLNILILAAGQGKRMHSVLPKVLHKLAGKPLLGHVIDTAQTLQPTKICTIYGHGGSSVPNAFDECVITCIKQEPQIGTGH